MKGGRKLSEWNLFVKKVYHEGKAKNSSYEFKDALEDASKRKSEMGSMKSSSGRGVKKSRKMMRKSRGKRSLALAGGRTRRHKKY
jgi:hypothetical protein